MRLLFKQRFFSWFDSYDIYDEDGNTVFTVIAKERTGATKTPLDITRRLLRNSNSQITDSSAGCSSKGESL